MVTVMPYERYVHYRRGKLEGVLEPGRHRFWSTGHDFIPVDLRVRLFDVKPQEVPTSDGITVKVSASARLKVVDPVAFHEFTEDSYAYVYDAVKTWLRETVHAHTLDEVITGISVEETPTDVEESARVAGFEISGFGIRDILIPADIRRATEELVTTRQQSQIALERARSEVAVLRSLANSAKVLEDHPLLATIRLAETAGSHGGTVIIERPST